MIFAHTTLRMIYVARKSLIRIIYLPGLLMIAEHSVVVAKQISPSRIKEKVYLFRTYDHEAEDDQLHIQNPGLAHKHEIWKVARATSAAPNYFKEIIIDGYSYTDGAAGHNNPAILAHCEVCDKETQAADSAYPIRLLVSIGTGQKSDRIDRVKHTIPHLPRVQRALDLLRRVEVELTNADQADQTVRTVMRQHKRDYYRWTGGEHIGALKLDKWKPEGRRSKLSTKDYIEQKVDEFVQSPAVKNKMRECAAALVNHRRARLAYNRSRWKRNTYCCKFRCVCSEDFDSPSPLRKHLHDEHHSTDFTNLYKFIDEDCHPEFLRGPY